MDYGAQAAFEIKYTYSRAFWLGILGLNFACIFIVWSIAPDAFDVTFSKPILDDNRVFIIVIALISISTLWGLRKKNQYASYVLDLRDTENLAIGYIYAPMMALSVTCWGLILAFHFEYPYSFLWCAVGLLAALFVFPRRTNYERIFRRVNADLLNL